QNCFSVPDVNISYLFFISPQNGSLVSIKRALTTQPCSPKVQRRNFPLWVNASETVQEIAQPRPRNKHINKVARLSLCLLQDPPPATG
ncbi:BarH-like 1 homeobox protein, partial [Araneus ventricosus]